MSNIKFQISNSIKEIIKQLGVSEELPVNLEIPPDPTHGDYTTNVAFGLSKILKKSPIEIAKEISSRLSVLSSEFTAEAVNGFINFWISKETLIKNLENMTFQDSAASPGRWQANEVRHDSFKVEGPLKGKRISVEFTDPNPFKEFHIGHLYSNTVGESICRLLESQGAIVWRADYFGDVGMHVAKSLWGLEKKFKDDNINIEDLTLKPLRARIQYLGQAYATGATAYEDDDIKEDMRAINRLVFIAAQKMWQEEKGLQPHIDYKKDYTINPEALQRVSDLYITGRRWSIEYFDAIYARLGMKFDAYYPESIAGEKGYQLVKKHTSDGIFEENDGAIIFRGEAKGLHTRVFINSLGFPTYEAKELGLAPWKYEDFQYDESIIITGNEINEYFKVLIAAMLAVEPDLGQKTKHISHGMVNMQDEHGNPMKMSSRTGKILTGQWLLDEAVDRAKKLSKNDVIASNAKQSLPEGIATSVAKGEPPRNDNKKTAEQVGIGAIKYAFLKSGISKDIVFDFDSSLSFEGNSGPYIQYSYVRTQSILQKVKQGVTGVGDPQKVPAASGASDALLGGNDWQDPEEINDDELLLLRKIVQFDEIVTKAAKELAPSMVCTYLFDLAKTFSYFYQNNRIVDAKEEAQVAFRVKLTWAVGQVLAHGLFLLGIEAPKRM